MRFYADPDYLNKKRGSPPAVQNSDGFLEVRCCQASGRPRLRLWMVLAAPSVMASGHEYSPEAGLYRYSLAAWYTRLYSP
jgi:hypothetical protein